jgi:hypothetical protein
VFAVIVTVIVLELKAPINRNSRLLWPLSPTAISYAASYLETALLPGKQRRRDGLRSIREDLGTLITIGERIGSAV